MDQARARDACGRACDDDQGRVRGADAGTQRRRAVSAKGPGAAPFRHTWGMPIVLGVLTLAGLVAGLLGDGVWDALSVAALAVPVAVGGWHAFKPVRPTR